MDWEVYTDGSTKHNGHDDAVGAWAYVVLVNGNEFARGSHKVNQTTNQQMELLAAINALEYLSKYLKENDFVTIYSDSAYLINCYKNAWYDNWQRNGWVNSKHQPVSNMHLWKQLIPWFENHQISWVKVKGHMGNKWNEVVDELAQSTAVKED